jgi:hypothetical protein
MKIRRGRRTQTHNRSLEKSRLAFHGQRRGCGNPGLEADHAASQNEKIGKQTPFRLTRMVDYEQIIKWVETIPLKDSFQGVSVG